MSRAGEPVSMGSEVGAGIEPGRYARLVGWLNPPRQTWDDGSRFRFLIRCYRNDDADGRPTGEYRRTGLLFPTEW